VAGIGGAQGQLCTELKIDEETFALWLAGERQPPPHIVRAIEMIGRFSPNESRVIPHRSQVSPESGPTLVSLFSGAGGLDIGLENAGFHTLLATEIEPHACESLRANKRLATMDHAEFETWFDASVASQRCYGNGAVGAMGLLKSRLEQGLISSKRPLARARVVESDIRRLSALNVMEATGTASGEIDLIAGGAPCQPFSRAGKQEAVDCSDGQLFLEFVRLVDELRPRWFLFENVKGLVQHRTETLMATCSHCHVASPVSFGIRTAASLANAIDTCAACCTVGAIMPRWEKRKGGSLEMVQAEFARIGYQCSWKVLNARDFGVPQDRERLFLVGSRDGEHFCWPTPTHRPRGAATSLFEFGATEPHKSVRDALYASGHWRYGGLSDDAVLWVKNVVRPHDEPVTWSLDRSSPTVGAHQAAKLAIAPFGIPEAQLFRQQWHTLGRRQGDSAPVFVEHEYLTDLELMILQTFPVHWYLHGTRMQRAFQIGNAVPPLLAEAVGRSLFDAIVGRNPMAELRGAIAK